MSVTAPQGFVAAGAHVGIKPSGNPDLSLVATDDGQPVPAAGTFTRVTPQTLKTLAAPEKGKSHQVALENVDRCARVFIDGTLAAEFQSDWTAADARRQAVADRALAPDQAAQIIRVEVSGPAVLSHLKLFRDLYYTQSGREYPHTANTDRNHT